ncbi:hypothetical protein B0H19DRAFT_1105080 [Mycena capillaripes]|nr:hypothetical protein B0H19DRAFT_1105080 [Mycena capillaripes]
MLDLPQELTDKIIDCLHEDKSSLAECSRVCWAWVPATRFHIFADIILRRRWNRLIHPQFRPFLDMLATESCTFAPFVTRLTLEYLDGTPEEGQEFRTAFSLLSHLTSTTSLTFSHWHNLGVQPVHDLLSHLTVLSEITLEHVRILSAHQLFSMLEMCPSLTSLTVVSVSWGPSSSPIVYSHGGSIRKLRLGKCNITEFLDGFTQKNIISRLSCNIVEIRGISPEDISSVGRFLALVAGSLQQLTIGCGGSTSHGIDAKELFGKHVDLQKHTQLTTFRLDDIHVAEMNSIRSLSMLSAIRCALAGPHVEELVFHLRSFHTSFLDSLRWDHIDDLLSSPQLDSLRRVEFCLNLWESLSDVQEALTKRLPRSCARLTIIFTAV